MAETFDVGLNPETNDLRAINFHITGTDLVLQRTRIRLKTFFGEFILNQTVGLPYVAWTQQKPPDVEGIGAVIRAEIEGVEGVELVVNFSGSFNLQTQTLTFTGQVLLSNENEVLDLRVGLLDRAGNSQPMVIFFGRSGAIRG